MAKERVLFVCVHNSARSLMAEGFLKALAGDRFEVDSAGFEPGRINPFVVEAMREAGVDISWKTSKGLSSLIEKGERFDRVITVCGDMEDKCPVFPGAVRRDHWPFDDPSRIQGSDAEKLDAARRVRDQIERKVRQWLRDNGEPKADPNA